jgi:hypothetical protein
LSIDRQYPLLFDTDREAVGLAHDEDVSAWGAAISARLEEWGEPVSLLELQESIQMPLVQVWLALLLNGMTLEQRGDFYQTERVWVLHDLPLDP